MADPSTWEPGNPGDLQPNRTRRGTSDPTAPTTILHASGFVHDGKVTSVKITSYEGDLADIVNRVLNAIEHPKTTATVRTLDGYLVGVEAIIHVDMVDIETADMWHTFTTRSEPWPLSDDATPKGTQ